jgi:hypothetical protein
MRRLLSLAFATFAVTISTSPFQSAAFAQEPVQAPELANAEASRKIEVEVLYVQISEGEMKKLGIVPISQAADSGPFKRGLLSNGWSDVSAIVNRHKAKILTAPRVRAQNNQEAELRSYTHTPASLAIPLGKSYLPIFEMFDANKPKGSLLYYTSGLGVTVTPTINADETLNLVLTPGAKIKLSEGDKVLLERNLAGTQTITNMKDGEIVALTGAQTNIISGYDTKKPSNLLILVIPHFVRS